MENPQESSFEKKSWEVPWTFEQINSSANSWSLAGNAGVW
jgi:hypothetical protein